MTVSEFVKEQMSALGINYEYEKWTKEEKPKLYFIGEELTESETKDCVKTSILRIVSHNSGGFKDFFGTVNKIKNRFDPRNNVKINTENGRIWLALDSCRILPSDKSGGRTRAVLNLVIREQINEGETSDE